MEGKIKTDYTNDEEPVLELDISGYWPIMPVKVVLKKDGLTKTFVDSRRVPAYCDVVGERK